MRSWKVISAALVLGVSPLISLQPAAAAAMMSAAGAKTLSAWAQPVEQVQYRRWHRGPRHGWHHRRYYGSGAAALGGLAAGAIIGGAIANSQARANNDAIDYCSQRYRSYDPASGTYLGYDGNRHPCP